MQHNKEKKGIIFRRAEKYVIEYRRKQREQLKLKRGAEKIGNFYVAPEPKLAFVIRIRGLVGSPFSFFLFEHFGLWTS